MNARYQDGARGQFLSEDPSHLAVGNPDQLFQLTGQDQQTYLSNPQQLNSYSYALDNPITKSDPKGLSVGGVPLSPYEAAALLLFAPIQGSYDPVYEADQYAAQNDPVNQVSSMVMGFTSPVGAEGKVISPFVKVGERGGIGAGKAFSQSVKDAARAESSNCVFCNKATTKQPGPLQSNIDHAIPKSLGGNNTINNAQNTCRTCNLSKGTMTSTQYGLYTQLSKVISQISSILAKLPGK